MQSVVIIVNETGLLYVECVENDVSEYQKIMTENGFKKLSAKEFLTNMASAVKVYDEKFSEGLYNYILSNVDDIQILIGVVRLADSLRAKTTLPYLADILLKTRIDLGDDDDFIELRTLCAKAIANYKDTSYVGALLFCLNNKGENYKIRLACADALGRIGDKYAVEPLINVVRDEEEKSVYVKESAAFALGLLGDTSAIDPLVDIMESKQGFWDKFSFLKEKVIETLGRLNINSDKVLRVFKSALLDSSPMVRISTVEALMNSEYEEAPDLIRTVLHDENEEVQRNALIAMYNLCGKDILDEVISLPGYSQMLKEEAQSMIEEYEND